MTFDWLTYIDLASRLIDNRESDIEEAYLRASISRAYYGVFGTLWAKMGRKPGLSRASKHHILVMLLRNSAAPFYRRLAVDVDRLRRFRNEADYEVTPSVTLARAHAACALATSIRQRTQTI